MVDTIFMTPSSTSGNREVFQQLSYPVGSREQRDDKKRYAKSKYREKERVIGRLCGTHVSPRFCRVTQDHVVELKPNNPGEHDERSYTCYYGNQPHKRSSLSRIIAFSRNLNKS
jgi:hypothetical protein